MSQSDAKPKNPFENPSPALAEAIRTGFEEIVQSKSDDGSARYTSEMVEDLVVASFLQSVSLKPDAVLPPTAVGRIESFCTRIGVPTEESVTETFAAVEAYFAAHPVEPSLVASLTRLFNRLVGEHSQDAAESAKHALQFLSVAASNTPVRRAQDDEAGMSPLAVFGLRAPKKKS